jgi:hypothetical protein
VRWFSLLLCGLFLVLAVAGGGGPLGAADIRSQRGEPYPNDKRSAEDAEEQLVAFCNEQRKICKKICNLRFRDDLIGCPQSCSSREIRCGQTSCYKWSEQEFLIAERFGGGQCLQ